MLKLLLLTFQQLFLYRPIEWRKEPELYSFWQVELIICIKSPEDNSQAAEAGVATSGPHARAECCQNEVCAITDCLPATSVKRSARLCPSTWMLWFCTTAYTHCDLNVPACSTDIAAANGDSLPLAIINILMLWRKTQTPCYASQPIMDYCRGQSFPDSYC